MPCLAIQHLFASFLSRDQAYDQLIDIWHVAHPNLNNRTLSAKVDGIENGDIEHDEDDDSEYSYEEYTSSSYYDSDEYTEVSDEDLEPSKFVPVERTVEPKVRKVPDVTNNSDT
jgi:hypothetical protein